jgi:hypothetical protein
VVFAASLLCSVGLSFGQEVFDAESFDGPAGRTVEGLETGDRIWFASGRDLVLDGDGHVVIEGEGRQSGWMTLPLPEIEPGEVLRVGVRVREATTGNGWIGIGFTQTPGNLFRDNGTLSAILRHPYGNQRKGAISLFPGPGTAKTLIQADLSQPPFEAYPQMDLVEMTYDTGSGEWTLSLNGHRLFRETAAFDGVAETPVPPDYLRYLCIQWQDQIGSAAPNPALLGEVRIERP